MKPANAATAPRGSTIESSRSVDNKPAGICGEGAIFHIARFAVPWTQKLIPTPTRRARRPQSLS